MNAEQDLVRAIDKAKSLDDQYEIKRVIHQALMDHYFKDQNPMLMNESEPEKAEALFKKVGEWMDRIFGSQEMGDDDLAFDVDLPNKFKIEVTQNHEGSKWYLCAYDNNGEHFSSYDCQNEKGVFAMISIVSQEEMRE